jgi:type II secretory ATPase GspE/PulE/Tfp pilus assembly ATPase PilB-like protein
MMKGIIMGQIIDFYSRKVNSDSNCGDFVAYDPEMPVAIEIFTDLDKSVLLEGCWVPLSWDMNGIVVLIDDPRDEKKKAAVKAELRTEWVIFKTGTKEDIEAFINQAFDRLEIDDFLSAAMTGKEPIDEAYLLNTIIADAYLRSVPEIHFEPCLSSEKIRVLFLMEDVLREYMTLPDDAAADDIVKKIKRIANLDITDNNLSKIGHIKFKHEGLPEFQVAVITESSEDSGEYIILRIPGRQEA